ncbi:hypothetical protein ABZ924_02925 [Streptomyces sp. NPDC046876]|uniref:hypothetical protein n=1 Tax=Streptomyces sp. NPDC046876 TaxID=3155616 RepID=UPI003405E00E
MGIYRVSIGRASVEEPLPTSSAAPAALAPITAAEQERRGTKPPTQTLTGAASLATPDVLFEVEALAAPVTERR